MINQIVKKHLLLLESDKRGVRPGQHEWSKNDQFLAYYFYKYGAKGLQNTFFKLLLKPGESDSPIFYGKELAKHIGVSYASLKMMSDNFGTLHKDPTCKLCDTKKHQKEIFIKWKDKSKSEVDAEMKSVIKDKENYAKHYMNKKKFKVK